MSKEAKPLVCAYCGDEIEDKPLRRGNKVYCSEACAFEASRPVDCSGAESTALVPPGIERMEKQNK